MVDAFISIVIEKLEGLGEDELKLLRGTREEVEKLLHILETIHPYLHDLEVKQFNEPEVGVWLSKLQYGLYEADDVLDEWQIKSQELSTGANLVWNFFAQCTCFHQLGLRHAVGKKIQKINGKLDDILTQSEKFKFLKSTNVMGEGTNILSVIPNDWQTDSSVRKIFGREDEINGIKDKLMNSSETSELAVVSIVGPAGIGKTTLANYVFNDGVIVQHFKPQIWVCVSDQFDVTSIMKKMIEAAKGDSPSAVENEEALRKKIADEVLKDKLFLLVLDDVWNEDFGKWEKLFNVIKNCGLRGSRILVTTRSETVCQVMGSAHIFRIGIVSSSKHCWSIFESVVFESRDECEHPELREVGKKIVEKCKGVPLAIKTVASVLRTKNTIKDWENVLKSDMWDWQPQPQLGTGTNIMAALLLSYYHLSPQLKQCFRYCAIYPKDYNISKDEIVPQWIAHGYILEKKKMEMEEVGENYFDELVACSLFQEPKLDEYNNITHCTMHDLVHDLALFVTKWEFLNVRKEENSVYFDADQYTPLHCTISDMESRSIKIGVEKLRTFISTPYNERELRMRGIQIEKMRHLRLLELDDWSIEELPDAMGNYEHLRYLKLCMGKFKAIPSSIGELQNLLYLDLSRTSIEALPKSVGMLRKLRHLNLSWNNNLKALPGTIGRLTNLRKLDLKRTRLDEISSSIGELQNLLYLDLSWTSIGALPESVIMLRKLRHLDLHCNENLKALPSTIGKLTDLRKLDLKRTMLDEIPSSIGEMQNLLYIDLFENENLKALSSTIGRLTNLRKLNLQSTGLDEIPDCIGKLASLHVLDVSYCQNIEKLPESIKDLSRLQALNVAFCEKLEQLPAGIFAKMTGLKELSVRGSSLQGLPAGIGKLTHLQRLDNFWVLGSHEDEEEGSSSSSSVSSSNICELRDLNHLHGSLAILNLDTVASGEEAASAQLHNKNSLISCLTLKWNTDGPGGAKEATTSEDVLQALCPCPTLHQLWIDGYPGREVPTWLGGSTTLMLSGLQELHLESWYGCTNLPALGNLPKLRRLQIWGMPEVRRVGTELFGSNHGFPKLEFLQFWDMAKWEDWDSLVDELFSTFPCLSELEIWHCPKLRSLPPIFSPSSLRKIEVRRCYSLTNWLEILPASIVTLGSISAEWVNGLPSLPNLEHLTISGDDGVSKLSNHLVKLSALKKLEISDCPNLESLPQKMASLKQLQELEIWNCPKLKESCQKEGAEWYKIQHIPCIKIDGEDVRQND